MPKTETAELKDKKTGKVEKVKYKEGALTKMLGFTGDQEIGMPNLRKLRKAEVGQEVVIKGGKGKVTMTKLMKSPSAAFIWMDFISTNSS